MTSSDRGPWCITYTGRQVYPLDMHPADVDIEDIAHSLSLLCRFNGHCRTFYSVAQHSVIVSQNVPTNSMLVALLHDASEAYCGDMVRPLKRAISQFSTIESHIWRAVAARFILPLALPLEVKEADARALMTERRDLVIPHPWPWDIDQVANPKAEPYKEKIKAWPPAAAEEIFLEVFNIAKDIARV